MTSIGGADALKMSSGVPFYASPARHKTSAEIISEAKAVMHFSTTMMTPSASISGPRAIGTRRPHTPRDPGRVLFGPDARRHRPQRPPSSFNLRHLRFHALESLEQQLPLVGNPAPRPKPGQLPKGTSLDEELFSSLLTDSDMKKGKKMKKAKVNMLLKAEMQAETSKPKLPTLSGMPKPLHKRLTLQSLHEEREEAMLFERRSHLGPSILQRPTTSPEVNQLPSRLHRIESQDRPSDRGIVLKPALRRDFSLGTDSFDEDTSGRVSESSESCTSTRSRSEDSGVAQVFSRRRLFTDYKSSSADAGLGRLLSETDEPDPACFEKIAPRIEMQDLEGDLLNFEEQESKAVIDQTKIRAATKLAIEIPSPDMNENWLKTGRQPSGRDKKDSRRILEILASKTTIEPGGDDKIVDMLKELYDGLEEEGVFLQEGGKRKSAILKTLYNFVESTDDRILICIARILLAMRVTGNNLSAAFKLIFKVARNDKNDHLFLDDNIMELVVVSIGRTSPCESVTTGTTACSTGYGAVYALGALRFLALGARTRKAAAQAGANHLMALHLKMINTQKKESPRVVGEDVAHALYQLTGAMRNMAQYNDRKLPEYSMEVDQEDDPVFEDFLTSGAVQELCTTVELFATDLDVVTNVSRILSVVSGRTSGREILGACRGWSGALLRTLTASPRRRQLAVRLTYALGNMAAHSDRARLQIFEEPGSIEYLLDVIELYVRICKESRSEGPIFKYQKGPARQFSLRDGIPEDPENSTIGSDLAGSDGSNDDVLIKSIRVVANVCLHSDAGKGALSAGGGRALPALLAAVRCAARIPDASVRPQTPMEMDVSIGQRSVTLINIPEPPIEKPALYLPPSEDDSPLTVTALAALSNLTYYIEDNEEDNRIQELQIDLCKVMFDVLELYGHSAWGSDCCVEALRVLGNASRWKVSQNYLITEGGLQKMVTYLYSPISEARRSSAGVLVNCAGGGNGGAQSAGTLARAALCSGTGAMSHSRRHCINRTKNEPGGVDADGVVDWRLRMLLAQAAWNAAEASEDDGLENSSSGEPTTPDDVDEFVEVLDEMLDEEKLFGPAFSEKDLPPEDGYDYEAWEEFAAVAANLLDRLCSLDHRSSDETSIDLLDQ